MEIALLNYFVLNNEIRSTCDFNPYPLKKGLSIYEVLRVQEGVPLFLDDHIRRFYNSAQFENITLPFGSDSIKQRLKALLQYNKISTGNVKFLYHKSPDGDSRFMAWLMPFFYPSGQQYSDGVKVEFMEAERPRPNAKKALYVLREKADKIIKQEKCFEVLYCNSDGLITEGSRSNIFFVADDALVTPEESLVLPGVTRMKIIGLALENGIQLRQQYINRNKISEFEACFLTGTSPKVLPVAQLGEKSFDVNHPLTRKLMEAYDELVESDLKQFAW